MRDVSSAALCNCVPRISWLSQGSSDTLHATDGSRLPSLVHQSAVSIIHQQALLNSQPLPCSKMHAKILHRPCYARQLTLHTRHPIACSSVHRNLVLTSSTLAARISSPMMIRAAVRVSAEVSVGCRLGLPVRPALSKRPSASMWAGANVPSSFLRELHAEHGHIEIRYCCHMLAVQHLHHVTAHNVRPFCFTRTVLGYT